MTIRRARAAGPTGTKKSAKGLTLLEMLVVFLLLALLSTLLIQGFSFFLGSYETVRRAYRHASLDTLHQRWFASTVSGMVPYRQPNRSFAGDASSFGGITLRPLVQESGVPVRARWIVDPEAAPGVVIYEEEVLAAKAAPVRWPVLTMPDEALSFRYADTENRWHAAWPPRGEEDRIPRMVSLVSESGATLWLARLDLDPLPIQHFREPL